MPAVIDVDSHWTFPFEFRAKQSRPLKRFAEMLPDEADTLAFFFADDLMRSLPVQERPVAGKLFPARIDARGTTTHVPERHEVVQVSSNAADRVAWMDRIGIDYAIVNSGGFPAAFPVIENLKSRQEYCQVSNDLLAAELDGHTDRLGAVTYADLHDLDWAINELTRMRAAGSRAFSIRAEPVDGRSLGHPHFDRLWSALTDLGMIVSVHTGLAPTLFGDWGRLGLNFDDRDACGRFLRLANANRHHSAEMTLAALLFGGVFKRHPKLTVLVSELYAYWLPNFIVRMEQLSSPSGPSVLGPWSDPVSGGEYLRRQVRVSPLPGLGDINPLNVLRAEPDMVVFSSDYPHAEGNADPIALYGPELQAMDPNILTKFMGSTMVESFARMGDPIA